jgi:hypothetical protein
VKPQNASYLIYHLNAFPKRHAPLDLPSRFFVLGVVRNRVQVLFSVDL